MKTWTVLCSPRVSFDFGVWNVMVPLWLLGQEKGQYAAMVKLQVLGTWCNPRMLTYAAPLTAPTESGSAQSLQTVTV